MGKSIEACHAYRKAMFEKLENEYKLLIKNNWQVFPVEDRGLDFVGYVFRSNSTRLRKGISLRFSGKCRAIKRVKMSQPQMLSGLMSYWGWTKYANAKRLWKSKVDATILSIADSYGTKRNPLRKVMA